MGTGRLEAFSDGVIAIILTIMVLDLHAPLGSDIRDLGPLVPVFLSYLLSFIYVGIYWNNHHHMLTAAKHANGAILWANLHLLFWLSLIPFATRWMGENNLASGPAALYGVILFMAAIAYALLQRMILKEQGKKSLLGQAVGKDCKGKLSPLLYALAIALSFVWPLLAQALYAFVALMWFIPDRRIEKIVVRNESARKAD